MEVFGGNVNLKHVLISRPQDDALDGDFGWTGSAQFVVILQDNETDNGFEASNQEDNFNAAPRSNPEIYNVTMLSVGPESSGNSVSMAFKEGTGGQVFNFIVAGAHDGAIDIQDSETPMNLMNGNLEVQNGIFYNIGANGMTYFPADSDNDNFDEQEFFQVTNQSAWSLTFGEDPGISVRGRDVDRLGSRF